MRTIAPSPATPPVARPAPLAVALAALLLALPALAPAQSVITRTLTGCQPGFFQTCASIAFESVALAGGRSDVTVSVTNLQGRGGDNATWSAVTGFVISSNQNYDPFVQETVAPEPNALATGTPLADSWGIIFAFSNVGLFGGMLETPGGNILFDGIGGCGVGEGADGAGNEVRQGVRTCAPGSAALFRFSAPYLIDPRAFRFVNFTAQGEAEPFGDLLLLEGSCTFVSDRGLGPACAQVTDVATVSTVPEPASVALLGSGVALLGGVAARRRRAAALG